MTKRGAVTMKDVAAALGCDEKAAPSRLVALGYVEPCSRCAGSGHHSRCEQYGTMCFKCRGNGRQIVKLTWAIVDAAKARQGAGELDAYFARIAAKVEARKAIAPLMVEIVALYTPIADAYSAACKRGYGHMPAGLFAAQAMANSLRWGQDDNFAYTTGAARVEALAKRGEMGPIEAVAALRAIIVDLQALRAAADPLLDGWVAEALAAQAA